MGNTTKLGDRLTFGNAPSKNCIWLAFVLSLIGAGFVVFKSQRYIEKRGTGHATVLGNGTEGYILIGKEINGYVGTEASFYLGGSLGYSSVTDSSYGVTLIHFDDSGYSVHELDGLQCSGNAFIYEGQLYFEHLLKGLQKLTLWKWNGLRLETVDTPTANRILRSFNTFDEILKREGWASFDARFDTGATFPITCQRKSYTIRLNHFVTGQTVEDQLLTRDSHATNEHVVVSIRREIKHVGQRAYLIQFPTPNGGSE